jgi:subtilase family serine protease
MQKRGSVSIVFPGRLHAAIALLAACWLGFSPPARAAQQALKGHVPPVTKQLASIGPLESGARLDLAIGLPLRNREKLTNLLQELYQPSHPNFRHYLTADQFAASFGPTQEDYQAVVDFAKSHGLTVKGTHRNRTLLDVSGSVADIEKAFHVKMRVYQHPVEARTFFAPDVEPTLDLATPVLAISGLDNYVRPRPPKHRTSPLVQPEIRPLGGGGGGGGGGSGNTGPFEGFDYRNAYAAGVTNLGNGQSVGIFELFGFSQQDIMDYEDNNGIYPYINVTPVPIDGFDGDDNIPDTADPDTLLGYLDYAIEVTGDIEMAISMAPQLSSVLVYEGPTPLYEAPLDPTNYVQYATTTAQVNDVLNQMATDDAANQLSCSYQLDINLSTVQIFQQFAAQGQSFFQGSGDFGAYPGPIDEPSDDPYLTVVGGTTLTTASSDGSWLSETAWLTAADPTSGTPEQATGGGVSLAYPIPAWQQGISMTANQGSTTMRNLPDVALVAYNVDVVYGNDFIGESFDWTEGGTSMATPLWAGFMALVNQQAAANGQPPVGFANPALYAIGKSTNYHACFNDITTGNNFTPTSPSRYPATAGYDLCTGWGTMIGGTLMQALLAPPSENLVVTPPLGFTSSGPGGGPFTVASQTYTLSNSSSAALQWNLVNTTLWLNISATAGTLKPHGTSTFTASLNAAAGQFLIGNYSGNVSIVDVTGGTAQNRQFDLDVGNGGFESGDFTFWSFSADTNYTFVLAADDSDVAGTNALTTANDWQFVHSGLYGAYLGQTPTNGSISQAVATKPGQDYLVSFWLTSVPSNGLTIPNYFAARWNGSTLSALTNAGAFGWTNLQFVVPATAARTTLEFVFEADWGAYGLDDISVATAPAPVLQSAARTGGNITLTWSAVPNLSYQIQSATNISNPHWTNVASVAAPGNVVSASEPIGTAAQQFYRVILLPGP